jgi:hypothetical protein
LRALLSDPVRTGDAIAAENRAVRDSIVARRRQSVKRRLTVYLFRSEEMG